MGIAAAVVARVVRGGAPESTVLAPHPAAASAAIAVSAARRIG
ncbi:MAG TPA: hypothetical protein VGF70_01245 [Solirubrobacteraceae bacterium]